MSVEVEGEVRTYAAYLDEVLPTITADELMADQILLASDRPSWWRRRPVLVAVAAAAATVILIGGVALLIRSPSGDRSPVATQPTPATIPITQDLFPIRLGGETVLAPWDSLGWGIISVDDPQLLADGVALIVHPRFHGYLLGYPDSQFDDVWISGDGTTWEQVTLPEMLSEQGELIAKVSDIAVGGPGLVAVGYGVPEPECETFPIPGALEPGAEAPMEGCIPQGSQFGVVWTSEDGRTWTRLPTDPVFDGARIHGVASDGDSLLAVGFHHESGTRGSGDMVGHSVVWTSADGITWTRLSHNQELLGDSVMYDLIHGPAGYLAVGWALPRNDPETSIYWLSANGRDWARVQLPGELQETLPAALLIDDSGYYVSVMYRDGEGPDWASSDGITWIQVPVGSFPTR
jgi:hypothetical protein